LSLLQEASSGGDSQGAAELLKDGHLLEEADKYGRTCLFYSGQAGDWRTINVLLRAGADPLAEDNRGRHPLDEIMPSFSPSGTAGSDATPGMVEESYLLWRVL